MVVRIEVHGLQGRRLTANDFSRSLLFSDRQACNQDRWVWRRELSRSELVTNVHALTVEISLSLFELFHWDPGPELLARVFEQIWK